MIFYLKKFGGTLHWTKSYDEAMDAYKKTSKYGVELWAINGKNSTLLATK